MTLEVKKIKVVVMVPAENLDAVRNAVCQAGAGLIGDYSFCTVATECISTFMGNKNASPSAGHKLQLETVNEIKLEAICTPENVKAVLRAIRDVHPYEEPGIDLYPMLDEESL